MEPEMVAGMVFTLVLALMIGGFILVYPLSRRVAALMERRMEEKQPAPRPNDAELDAIRQAVAELSTQLDRLTDRQDFMEKLLTQRLDPRPLGIAAQQR
jgi:hypothetical protein